MPLRPLPLGNGDAWFMDVEYAGLSSGDYTIEDLCAGDQAESIAKRLVHLAPKD